MIKLKRTVFSRLLLFNLALIIAVTLITLMICYNYFNHKYIQESTRNNLLLVEQIRRSIDERILEKVISIPAIYLSRLPSNDAFIYPINHNIANESGAILNVSRRLEELKDAYEFIDSIDLYYPDQKMIFVNSTVCFLKDGNFERASLPAWLSEYQKNDGTKSFWLPLHKSNRHILSSQEVVTYVGKTSLGDAVLGINIKKENLNNLLTVMKINPQGFIWIIDNTGELVAGDGPELPSGRIRLQLINRVLPIGKAGMFTATIFGAPFVVSFSQSSRNNWRYISLVPEGSFYEKSRRVMLMAVLIGGVLLFLNLLGAIAVTKKAHKPLAPVLQTLDSLASKFGGDFEKNADEYKMLNATLDTLAGTIEVLTKKLDENKSVIRHKLIGDLLYGQIDYDQWQIKYRQIYGQDFDKALFSCFIIQLKVNSAKPDLDFQRMMLIAYNLINSLEQQEFPWKVRAIVGDDHQNIIGIINHSEGLKRSELFKKMLLAIEKIYHGQYQLALGNSYQPDHNQVTLSFKQAQLALEYGFLFPELKLLDYRRLQPEALRSTGNFQRPIAKIVDYLRAGSLEELKLAIHQLFKALVNDGYQIDFSRNTIGDLISILHNTVTEMGFDTFTALGVDLRVTWKEYRDILTIKDWLEGSLTKIVAAIKEHREKFDDGLELKVKQFIANNIANELSLEKVANALNVRYDTLSRTFKAITGLSFVDYVKDQKMQNAASLLGEGKLNVQEVANHLGYHSVPYFIKLFKAEYGMTPKEFQRRNQMAQSYLTDSVSHS